MRDDCLFYQTCGHCHEELSRNKTCPYRSRVFAGKYLDYQPKQITPLHSKPEKNNVNYTPSRAGPLRSESYGKYVIGAERIGPNIMKVDDSPLIQSRRFVTSVEAERAEHKKAPVATPNRKEPDFQSRPYSTEINHDDHTCAQPNTPRNARRGIPQNAISGPEAIDKEVIEPMTAKKDRPFQAAPGLEDLPALTKTMPSREWPINKAQQDSNASEMIGCQQQEQHNETAGDAPGKPKVSLLVQLLESESDTETRILPRLMEEKTEKATTTSKTKPAADEGDSEKDLRTLFPEADVPLMESMLSSSEADRMLSLINLQELPDNLFNVSAAYEEAMMDPECQRAVESIQMTPPRQTGNEEQTDFRFGEYDLLTSSVQWYEVGAEEAEETDVHPHVDGVVEDLPDSVAEPLHLGSPALIRRLSKIVGKPLSSSSPLPYH